MRVQAQYLGSVTAVLGRPREDLLLVTIIGSLRLVGQVSSQTTGSISAFPRLSPQIRNRRGIPLPAPEATPSGLSDHAAHGLSTARQTLTDVAGADRIGASKTQPVH
ncbi:hypothetical protein L227DRAFT_356419 [Lentinus tigrinus ALCF2SS1-6]|uniref:Uncharacterized protein n=1 Tax=Lentinus tigrinus ALCF2SS1-6 TaxID=1328759 RepID=A0A5C2RUT0_9APHY|nr:hypothetical protein L227DRAFT_356419 [Lentinus tigrinus ALCF2SS1-6]